MRTTRSGESALLLLDVIDLLSAGNIEYAVIGALAASIHGAVRASMDADVVLSAGVPQAVTIGEKLKAEFGLTSSRGSVNGDQSQAFVCSSTAQ
jgi:hypothetical protein